MDEVFKALADPSRRQLLDSLHRRGGQTLQELCAGLDMARQSVSKHLAVLEAANLVTTVRRGREKLHYLNAAPINDLTDRWIHKYDRARVGALADLKHALEDRVGKPEFVYTTYITTTPERLWQGLTAPAFTRRYWGLAIQSDWQPGSTMTWALDNGVTIAGPEQVVLEADPYRRLAYTWHTFTPEWAEANGVDEATRAAFAAEPRSAVTFDIEDVGGSVKLTVTHDGFDPGSQVLANVAQGWPRVVSSLKTLLETPGYTNEVTVAAPPARVFAALTTADGLASWWTPAVEASGGELTFRFDEQRITMRIDEADPVSSVVWTCVGHSKFPEWRGTTLRFALSGDETTVLRFTHLGLEPELECYGTCSRGWDHYLASLVGAVTGAGGSPWVSGGPTRLLTTR
jgi:uncharacterized protein YndB with AHSA1/START domain/DNA-binding transcriptional ArsR family regulator